MAKYTRETFIKLANEKHNNRYTYENADYKYCRTKILITCTKHGDFLQTPSEHLSGSGCKECGKENISSKMMMSTLDFIERAKEKHNNKYNYDLTIYSGGVDNVKVRCPVHGVFEVNTATHINNRPGGGCQKCSHYDRFSSTENFISKSNKIHNGIYDYSKVVYLNTKEAVEIVCPIHGSFLQKPTVHLLGCGCSRCSRGGTSKPMIEIIDYVSSKYPELEIILEKKICKLCKQKPITL